MKDDSAYLHLMLDSLRKVNAFHEGLDLNSFCKDEKSQSAVILQLMVIGELAKRLSDETRFSIKLPWRRITGMRDWVAHDYFSLEIEKVWQTATEEASEAEAKIKAFLNKGE